jgi:CRISPR-associated endoribonuclease Cas6
MKLLKLHIRFEALNDALLPGQTGSMLRGIFGETLMEYNPQLYQKFFHPEITGNRTLKQEISGNLPAPFFFFPLKKHNYIGSGQHIDTHLTLLGEYRNYQNEIAGVIQQMCNRKWYNSSLQVKLNGIEPLQNQDKNLFDYNDFKNLKPAKNIYTLKFKSPLSVSSGKKLIADFDFNRLANFIQQRINLLDQLYDTGELNLKTVENHSIVPVSIQLRREKIYRSPKRNEKYPLTGWKGNITYKGDFEKVYPLLLFGQHIHMGSYIAFGFGKYTLK